MYYYCHKQKNIVLLVALFEVQCIVQSLKQKKNTKNNKKTKAKIWKIIIKKYHTVSAIKWCVK